MIKFILAVIAMIFVGLAAYVYMNPKETDAPVAKVAQKTEKSIVKKEAPSVEKESAFAKVEVVSEKKSSVKNTTVKSPKVLSHETSYEMVDTEEIGKGLTLEGIRTMDVSKNEKERLRDDLAHYQIKNIDMEDESEKRRTIGKELTYKDIMSANISSRERESLLDDLAYFQTNDIDIEQ